jgi:serine protease
MPGTQTGFIVLELHPDLLKRLPATSGDDLRALARQAGADSLWRILEACGDCQAERVVRSVAPERLAALEAEARERGKAPARSLTAYWRLDAGRIDAREALLSRLAEDALVADAHFESTGSDPTVDPTDDAFAALQLHLDPAPVGIDAEWAWTQSGGAGSGVGLVDLEQGWILAHEDLPAIATLPGVPQDVKTASERHGTAVLGIAVGVDNARGIIGVAPTPAWVGVASHYRAADQSEGHVTDAIAAVLASGAISDGDVLLIEYQDSLNRPIEMVPSVRTAIQLATSLGVVVVECAGNGGLDLDAVPELNRTNPATFQDSGAIIVGGCRSSLDAAGLGHDRWILVPGGPGSNFGSRIDCHAYAENVVTAGAAANPADALGSGTLPTDRYRSDFGGTSAAAAIVAGAAVVLQGLHKAHKKAPLTAQQMRDALASYGTPQGSGEAGQIGVLPDLRRAAEALFGRTGTSAPSAPTNVRIAS